MTNPKEASAKSVGQVALPGARPLEAGAAVKTPTPLRRPGIRHYLGATSLAAGLLLAAGFGACLLLTPFWRALLRNLLPFDPEWWPSALKVYFAAWMVPLAQWLLTLLFRRPALVAFSRLEQGGLQTEGPERQRIYWRAVCLLKHFSGDIRERSIVRMLTELFHTSPPTIRAQLVRVLLNSGQSMCIEAIGNELRGLAPDEQHRFLLLLVRLGPCLGFALRYTDCISRPDFLRDYVLARRSEADDTEIRILADELARPLAKLLLSLPNASKPSARRSRKRIAAEPSVARTPRCRLPVVVKLFYAPAVLLMCLPLLPLALVVAGGMLALSLAAAVPILLYMCVHPLAFSYEGDPLGLDAATRDDDLQGLKQKIVAATESRRGFGWHFRTQRRQARRAVLADDLLANEPWLLKENDAQSIGEVLFRLSSLGLLCYPARAIVSNLKDAGTLEAIANYVSQLSCTAAPPGLAIKMRLNELKRQMPLSSSESLLLTAGLSLLGLVLWGLMVWNLGGFRSIMTFWNSPGRLILFAATHLGITAAWRLRVGDDDGDFMGPFAKTMCLGVVGVFIAITYSFVVPGWISQMQFCQFLLIVHIVPLCTVVWRGSGTIYPRTGELWLRRIAAVTFYGGSLFILAILAAWLGPFLSEHERADTFFYGVIGLLAGALMFSNYLRSGGQN